jgi:asparagine synthase (glutamine-hydrolysing)
MGIWFDEKEESSFPFITLEKKIMHFRVGLIHAPYQPGTIHHYNTPSNTFLLAVDGEIENFHTLLLSFSCALDDTVDRLIYTIYQNEGAEGFFKIKGSVSFIFFDNDSREVILYRAFLKGHPLYFTRKNNRLSVSTNAVYLLHRDDIKGRIDKTKVLNLFTVNLLAWTGTVFEEIDEVKSGEMVIFTPEGVEKKSQSLEEIFDTEFNYNDEGTALENYRQILHKAVDKNIDKKKKYGIMLSSGIDSSSIAYYAVKNLHSVGKKLTAYSWTLPEDSADESENIQLLCDKLGIELKLFNGEKYGPFDMLDKPFLQPDTPFINLFWPLNQACYREAHKDGIDYLFNGNYADLLFPSRRRLIDDIIKDRRFDLLPSEVLHRVQKKGVGSLFKSLISKFVSVEKIKVSQTIAWMSEEAKQLVSHEAETKKKFEEYRLALSEYHMGYLGTERYLSGKYALYRKEPHRDLDLIHYSLGFPSYMTYRGSQSKYFVRKAMQTHLPKEITKQPRVGHLGSILLKSFERNREKVEEKLWENPSDWNTYVKESWIREKLRKDASLGNRDLYIIWLCINLTAWLKAIKPDGELYGNVSKDRSTNVQEKQ